MILNNMMIIDRLRYDDLRMFTAICNMDYVIIREEDNTYTFLKNR